MAEMNPALLAAATDEIITLTEAGGADVRKISKTPLYEVLLQRLVNGKCSRQEFVDMVRKFVLLNPALALQPEKRAIPLPPSN